MTKAYNGECDVGPYCGLTMKNFASESRCNEKRRLIKTDFKSSKPQTH